MKSLFLHVLLFTLIFYADARSRRTDNLPFKSRNEPLTCDRTFSSGVMSNNNYTFTIESASSCTTGRSTSVNKALFSISTLATPTFTIKAFKSASDAAPQFSATLVLYEAFEYTDNNTGPGYHPTDIINSTQLLFNSTVSRFTQITASTAPIENTGKSVTTLSFRSVLPLRSTLDVIFTVDLVEKPSTYDTDNVGVSAMKITLDVENYYFQSSLNFAIRAYLITEKNIFENSTVNERIINPLKTNTNDVTGGIFSWDSKFIDISAGAYTASNFQDMYFTPFALDSSFSKSQVTDQAGNVQRIIFSSWNAPTSPITIVWDSDLSFVDVGAGFSLRIDFAFVFIVVFATVIGILL